MLPHSRAAFRCLFALGLCINSTGCIFLGAYPLVQDVPGPVRGIRVLDSQSQQDIPDAQVSLNTEWGGINQFDSRGNGASRTYELREHPEKVWQAGFLGMTDTRLEGLLPRDKSDVFRIGLRKRLVPGIGIAGISFGDGPGYMGPLGKKHGEFGYNAIVTAWAPQYKPLQISYHAPLFAKFECSDCEFDPRTGILAIALCRAQTAEETQDLQQISAETPPASPPRDNRLGGR